MQTLTVTLIGKVNAGKSLLCNKLLNKDYTDVSPVAGWTKEISIYPLGIDVVLADTPGLDDPEEAISKKTFDFLGETDIFLHVINANEGLTKSVKNAHEKLRATQKPVVLVCNKTDHLDENERKAVAAQLSENLVSDCIVVTSAKNNIGVKTLTSEIMKILSRQGDALKFYRFMKTKLPDLEEQVKKQSNDADESINWATGRAAVIAISPLPLADVYPLVANQLYMARKIGENYGLSLGDSAIKGLIGAMGASFAGLVIASFLPGFKIVIAASITFGVGKAIKGWCASGGSMTEEKLREIYEKERENEKKRRRS